MERRQGKRYQLRLRCHVTARHLLGPITGCSENIGRSGILMRCDDGEWGLPEPGQEVEVDLELPSNPNLKRRRSLFCRTTVAGVRSGLGGELYLALVIHYMQFRDLPWGAERSTSSFEPTGALM